MTERQVVHADLQQFPGHLEARQVHVRPRAGGGDDGQPRRCSLDEPLEAAFGVGRRERVEVVDDEQEARWQVGRRERVERVVHRLPARGKRRHGGPERRFQSAQHAHRVPVPGIGAVPRDRSRGIRDEPVEERRLARAGGRYDERQPMLPGLGKEGGRAWLGSAGHVRVLASRADPARQGPRGPARRALTDRHGQGSPPSAPGAGQAGRGPPMVAAPAARVQRVV